MLLIFDTDTDVVRPNHDLTAQLSGRKERLSWLIKFINDNSALTKVRTTGLYTCAPLMPV